MAANGAANGAADGAADARLPVCSSTDGPFMPWALRAHTMVNRGQIPEALAAVDHFTPLVRLAGDEITVGYLLQMWVAALLSMRNDHEAAEVGQNSCGCASGWATPSPRPRPADLAGIQFRLGLLDEGIDGLARAHAVLSGIDKLINGTYSHAVGDRVLVEIAAALRASCRDHDVPTRYGGDEFAVFLRTDVACAVEVGERIRQAVADRDWDAIAPGLKVTISMGVAELAPQMTAEALLAAADERLYRAKRGGRNSVAA